MMNSTKLTGSSDAARATVERFCRQNQDPAMTAGRTDVSQGFAYGKRRPSQAGLTLVEMMVVLVILGLLTTIIVVNVLPAADQASVQKARTDIALLENALDQYRLQLRSYPTPEQGLEALVSPPGNLSNPELYRPGGYIRKLPMDPWGSPYVYQYPGEFGEVDIYSFGADGREGGEGKNADLGNWQ